MTSEEQIKIYNDLNDSIMKTARSKANDYAGADVLSNFKNVTAAAKALDINITKPEQYALFMVILKIARLTNLLNSGKTPSNESVDDSFLDGINYFKLAYCNYLESKDEKVVP